MARHQILCQTYVFSLCVLTQKNRVSFWQSMWYHAKKSLQKNEITWSSAVFADDLSEIAPTSAGFSFATERESPNCRWPKNIEDEQFCATSSQ